MKFRIKYVGGKGYFPQVRLRRFFWFKWYTIGTNFSIEDPYPLYPENDLTQFWYLKSAARDICQRYMSDNSFNPKSIYISYDYSV